MKKLIIILEVLIVLGSLTTAYSQFLEFSNDVFSQNQYGSSSSYFMGNLKPERTDLSGGNPSTTDSRFPILIVFVQFANETEEDQTNWPIGGSPTYLNNLLSYEKKTNSNWWQAYSPTSESMSSFFHEMSRGKMHVVGKCVNIVLDSSAQHYRTYYASNSEAKVNFDVYEKLKIDTSIHWQDFDLWKKGNDGLFYFQKDGYVDMIYMVHRRTWANGPVGNYEGYTPLGNVYINGNNYSNYTIYETSTDTIKINGNYSSEGSGCKILGKFSAVDKKNMIAVAGHEHGHYLFGSGHITYAKMCYGYGLDFSLSPWEIIKLGYSGKVDVNLSQNNNYYLNDFSARDTSNKTILQVPITSTANDEFFLIANRRKVSDWDRIMLGDTAHDNPLRDINAEYGKGIYIYHITNGYYYPSYQNTYVMDQECADGLWNWEYVGTTYPDWSTTQSVDVYNKVSVSYVNDQSNGGYSAKDGKSVINWFSIGKLHSALGGDGTDRIYTNDESYWTSREWKGDRWDGWNVGYNEIFSPYSSPNTFSWNNDTTGIYIWFDSLNGNTANIKIYKVGENGFTRDSILKITPPSRPMGLKLDYTECMDSRVFPVLTWNHNMEPDMIIPGGSPFDYKRYKIFRAYDAINNVPGNFTEIADINCRADITPTYTDYNAYLTCSGIGMNNYRIRYKIKAVDNTIWASVYSDFVATPAYLVQRVKNPIPGNNLPKEYNLSQNYPNPFNPVTKINYDLPKDSKVSLVIYDILGREIVKLVNGEFKTAGRYMVDFNGSNLASGVYFYRIQAGDFVNVKRMVLIK